jgi:hypothetical protein
VTHATEQIGAHAFDPSSGAGGAGLVQQAADLPIQVVPGLLETPRLPLSLLGQHTQGADLSLLFGQPTIELGQRSGTVGGERRAELVAPRPRSAPGPEGDGCRRGEAERERRMHSHSQPQRREGNDDHQGQHRPPQSPLLDRALELRQPGPFGLVAHEHRVAIRDRDRLDIPSLRRERFPPAREVPQLRLVSDVNGGRRGQRLHPAGKLQPRPFEGIPPRPRRVDRLLERGDGLLQPVEPGKPPSNLLDVLLGDQADLSRKIPGTLVVPASPLGALAQLPRLREE